MVIWATTSRFLVRIPPVTDRELCCNAPAG